MGSWYKYIGHLSSRIFPTKFCSNYDYITKTSTDSKKSVNYFKSYQNVGADVAEFIPGLVCPSKYIFVDNVGLISTEEYVISGGSFEKTIHHFICIMVLFIMIEMMIFLGCFHLFIMILLEKMVVYL